MFETEYQYTPIQGLSFTIGFRLDSLNESDRDLDFDIRQVVDDWITGDDFDECKISPQLLCVGLWLHITSVLKKNPNNLQRRLVCRFVRLKGINSDHAFINKQE